MFVVNFSKQFADAVARGEKRQTVRKERKDGRRPVVGGTLALYTGMRTKSCRLLRETACTRVLSIEIDLREGRIALDGVRLSIAASIEFARLDGFPTLPAFLEWFQKSSEGIETFRGFCIRWQA
jgi:hypothetical protein